MSAIASGMCSRIFAKRYAVAGLTNQAELRSLRSEFAWNLRLTKGSMVFEETRRMRRRKCGADGFLVLSFSSD